MPNFVVSTPVEINSCEPGSMFGLILIDTGATLLSFAAIEFILSNSEKDSTLKQCIPYSSDLIISSSDFPTPE